MSSRWMRNSFIYLLIVVAVIAIFFTLFSDVSGTQEIPINEVVAMAKSGSLESIEVRGDKLTIMNNRGEAFTSARKTDPASWRRCSGQVSTR